MIWSFYSLLFVLFFFFFKQKTAYEMRISDWSSDVCSSDLDVALRVLRPRVAQPCVDAVIDRSRLGDRVALDRNAADQDEAAAAYDQIGRASCRERVCQYV